MKVASQDVATTLFGVPAQVSLFAGSLGKFNQVLVEAEATKAKSTLVEGSTSEAGAKQRTECQLTESSICPHDFLTCSPSVNWIGLRALICFVVLLGRLVRAQVVKRIGS